MRTLIEANLCDGVIYGDNVNLEYVYMPASEIGVKILFVFLKKFFTRRYFHE